MEIIPMEQSEIKEEVIVEVINNVIENETEEVIKPKILNFDDIINEHNLNKIEKHLDAMFNVMGQFEANQLYLREYQGILSGLPKQDVGINGSILGLVVDKIDVAIETIYREYAGVKNTFATILEKAAARNNPTTA